LVSGFDSTAVACVMGDCAPLDASFSIVSIFPYAEVVPAKLLSE
jgi:hypothetical protein